MKSSQKLLGRAFFAVALILLAVAVWSRREEFVAALGRLDAGSVVVSLLLACLALVAQLLSWRALLAGTGQIPHLSACARIYFHGQLGKYVPGGVWSVVAQAQLAKAHGVSRARSTVVALGAMAVLLVTGGTVAVIGLAAGSSGSLHEYWWAIAVVPIGIVGLTPAVFNRVVSWVLALLRRGDQTVAIDLRGIATSAFWAVVMWLIFGLHTAVLAHAMHGDDSARTAMLSLGAFALAWVVGIIVIIAPAGAGAREAALVLALSPVLGSSDALTLALVSRVLMVISDALAAGTAALLGRGRPTPDCGESLSVSSPAAESSLHEDEPTPH